MSNYISIDLDDPRTNGIADVISNKTCKKILGLIAESEMSESDIAAKLKMPLNTVGYNIKKLVDAGLIERTSKFFWSEKGKKIHTYKVSNKKIVISPKSSFKGLLPALITSVALALGIKVWGDMNVKSLATNSESLLYASDAAEKSIGMVAEAAPTFAPDVALYMSNSYLWFMLGALISIFVIVVWNWRKIW